MSDFPHVHWHEGLFLQPHHLQLLQRDLTGRIAAGHLLTRPFPYGVIELSLSPGALENKRLQIATLHAVMPSGRVVWFPGNADVSDMDIRARFDSSADEFLIYLGVPLHNPEDSNALPLNKKDDGSAKRLYHVIEKEFRDENTGENKQVVQLRRLNARLTLTPEKGMESIPLTRIGRRTINNASVPAIDTRYTPPALVLDGWTSLREDLRSFGHELSTANDRAKVALTYGGFQIDQMQGGIKLEKWLRCMTLNRYSSIFAEYVRDEATCAVSPFQMYLTLRQLLAELAVLRPTTEGPPIDIYRHEDCGPIFAELLRQIRQHLTTEEAAPYWKVELKPSTRKEGNAFIGALTDEQLSKPTEYFLAIQTAQDPNGLSRIVEDTNVFKLMSESTVFKAWPPVVLKWELQPPMEFDRKVDLHFFRVQRDKGMMWNKIVTEKMIAARWPGIDTTDFQIWLYMRVPRE